MSFDSKKFVEDINKKWITKGCQVCGHMEWVVSDKVFELNVLKENIYTRVSAIGPVQPVVPVTCTYCGNTIFINPMISKSLQIEEDEEDGQA